MAKVDESCVLEHTVVFFSCCYCGVSILHGYCAEQHFSSVADCWRQRKTVKELLALHQ